MKVLRAGAVYFVLAFGAGFMLGVPRVLWLVPLVGVRAAELIEMPIMLVVIVFAARWVCRRFAVPRDFGSRLAMGLVALALLLAAEFSFVLWLRGLTFGKYFAGRDPVAGAAYVVMLLVFALMPLLVRRNQAFLRGT
jgi:hypothetical protein